MKKSILFGAGTLLLLAASCSNDEVVEQTQEGAISFKTIVDKNAARSATVLDNTSLLSFKVWGYKMDAEQGNPLIFNSQIVERESGAALWDYEPKQFWAVDMQYSFTALASNLEESNAVFSPSVPSIYNQNGFGSFKFDNSKAKGLEDITYAYNNRQTTNPISAGYQPVSFEFSHALSRVKFTFKNAVSDAYDLKIGSLKINDAYTSGVFEFPSCTWKVDEATSIISFTDGVNIPFGNSGSIGFRYIIPHSNTFTITFDVVAYVKGTETAVNRFTHKDIKVSLSDTELFNPGYSYNFTAELTADNVNPSQTIYPIQFAASVKDWQPAGDSTEDNEFDVKKNS